jgi:hypothetical protein
MFINTATLIQRKRFSVAVHPAAPSQLYFYGKLDRRYNFYDKHRQPVVCENGHK